ncbi:DUF1289 domain-containing protein [Chachezhania sediminis]|uniref:DUF1289 domain-containing protein n=1 Tax=Chachezhania sediminis TaxID=2599291 RepID=UPI00131C3585|nr:DUF1289 domain-containing protein [Chachezhania sediminis]
MNLASPCVGNCTMDATTGFCLGCARTTEEIAGWGLADAATRGAIWDVLPARLERLGVTCRRLDWTTDQVRTFVRSTLEGARGTWVAGVLGGVGEFCAAPGKAIEVEEDGDNIIARTEGARLRFLIDDAVRALTFEAPDIPPERARIVLAVKRERGRPPVADGIAALGPDRNAIDSVDRRCALYDLGLGRKEARFCVRVAPGPAHEAMDRALGIAFPACMGTIGHALLAESPARVIETPLGRVEVLAPIPAPGGQSPVGPHTHLLPDLLSSGRATPVGMDMPRAYLPGAIFYPRS